MGGENPKSSAPINTGGGGVNNSSQWCMQAPWTAEIYKRRYVLQVVIKAMEWRHAAERAFLLLEVLHLGYH